MKSPKILTLSISIILTILLAACTGSNKGGDKPTGTQTESSISSEISKDTFFNEKNTVTLSKINNNVWVHTTYTMYNGSNTPSNGLIIITSEGLVLVDTPWDNTLTKDLIKLSKETFKKDYKLAIITHAHDDRIGGISTLLENKIEVNSTALTLQKAVEAGFEKPQATLDTKPTFKIGDTEIETYYPGEGHSPDNIVVWLPKYKILFGGCLVKSADSSEIGNTTDANLTQWPVSLKKLQEKFPDAEVVIPGHGSKGDKNLIGHTIELLQNNNR